MWLTYDAWIWWADELFWYAAVPIIVAVFCLELWLTKLRAARYKATLHEIADGNYETEYNMVRAQRDRFVKMAKEALYAHW
jgi:hypothetical protein